MTTTTDRYHGALLGLAAPWWQRSSRLPRAPSKTKSPRRSRVTGYVVRSLEAALWAFHRTEDFPSGALLAVNLGDDADTTGAIYGQLAGAYYGVEDIPDSWCRLLTRHDDLVELADGLLEFSLSPVPA